MILFNNIPRSGNPGTEMNLTRRSGRRMFFLRQNVENPDLLRQNVLLEFRVREGTGTALLSLLDQDLDIVICSFQTLTLIFFGWGVFPR